MKKAIVSTSEHTFHQYYGTRPEALGCSALFDPKTTSIDDVMADIEEGRCNFNMGQLRQQFFIECSWSVNRIIEFLIRALQKFPDGTKDDEGLVRKINQITGNVNLGESNKNGKPVGNTSYICGFDLFIKPTQPRFEDVEAGTMDIIFRFKAFNALGGNNTSSYFPINGITVLRINLNERNKVYNLYNRVRELYFDRKYFEIDPCRVSDSRFPSAEEFVEHLEKMRRGETNSYCCQLDSIEAY